MSVHAIMIESADLSSEEILFQCKIIKCLKPDKIIELLFATNTIIVYISTAQSSYGYFT